MNFLEFYDVLFFNAFFTLFEAIIGLLIVAVLGIFIAVLMDNSKSLKSLLEPIIYFSQLVPAIVLAPLLLIWFGFGMSSTILLVVIMCIFPVITNAYKGLSSVDDDYLNLFSLMHANKYQTYMLLKIPSANKFIFSGLKIATTYAITSALLAEFMGAQNGLGVSLANSLTSFNTVNIFCIIIVTITLTIGLLKILDIIERRFNKYEKIS
ncbi:MAG: ABC transporter permease [Mycoplasmatales bacterium]